MKRPQNGRLKGVAAARIKQIRQYNTVDQRLTIAHFSLPYFQPMDNSFRPTAFSAFNKIQKESKKALLAYIPLSRTILIPVMVRCRCK